MHWRYGRRMWNGVARQPAHCQYQAGTMRGASGRGFGFPACCQAKRANAQRGIAFGRLAGRLVGSTTTGFEATLSFPASSTATTR